MSSPWLPQVVVGLTSVSKTLNFCQMLFDVWPMMIHRVEDDETNSHMLSDVL